MTEKDIEKMLADCDGLDMSHVKKEDVLAKAKQELYFSTESSENEKEKNTFTSLFTKKRFVSAFAGAAIAFAVCIGMIGLYNENFQTVYIDINPSVALKLNRFERVIGVEFLNDDAKTLLSDVKLIGCNATDAVQTVITACDTAGYVKSDSEIYISATSKQEQSSEKLLEKLKGHAETMREEPNETYSVNTYNAKKNEKKDFEKESLSPAKYNVISEILDEDDRYKLEDLKDKPMSELKKLHRELEERDDDDDRYEDDDDRDDRDDERKEPHEEKPDNGKHEEDREDYRDDDREDDDDDDDRDDEDDKKHKNDK